MHYNNRLAMRSVNFSLPLPIQRKCIDMKNKVNEIYKPCIKGQKSLYDFETKPKLKDGMPSWFWNLANECKAETAGC